MKKFLSTTKGKIIAGAVTFVVIVAAIVLIVLLNMGYRSIQVADLNGSTKITSGLMVSEAFKGQNLQNGTSVSVSEKSDLTLALDTDKHVFAKELTKFKLEAFGTAGKDSRTIIRLEEGSVLNEIDEKLLESESYVVDSPNATMAVRGTTFTVTVSYDSAGLCHTSVEVEKGTVEVIEKDENGFPTSNVQMLNAGDKTEIISEVKRVENPAAGGTTSAPGSGNPTQPQEIVYQNADAIAVENALEAYINGGKLDKTNFDRVTDLEISGRVAFVTLDEQFGGKGRRTSSTYVDGTDVTAVSYDPGSGEKIKIPTSNNSLTDLNFLTGMNNLRFLYVQSGKISDITAIRQLSGLIRLHLSFNEISDISPLEKLTKLSVLYLEENQISDISSIKNLKQLRTLCLPSNNISDISPISELKNLKRLILGDNNFSDISPISGLTNLTSLDFYNTNVSDLSPISGLTNLTRLEIDNTNISDISPIANFKKLTYISIYDSPINDYSPLYGLTGLQDIKCWGINDDELAKLQQALPGTSIDG